MDKRATTAFPVHDLIATRWSPRSFADRPVEPEKLGSLFEAARWAPSCFNEQPWRFLVTTSDDNDAFERFASCLTDGNSWAKKAPVLILSVARSAFERNGKPNRHALHDVGLAVGNLVIQAEALGLSVHQMAGFDRDRASDLLRIPVGFEPVAMIAVGYRGDVDSLPQDLADRERAPRVRKDPHTVVFGSDWDSAPKFLED